MDEGLLAGSEPQDDISAITPRRNTQDYVSHSNKSHGNEEGRSTEHYRSSVVALTNLEGIP